MKVLLVEHDPDLGRTISISLGACGYEVAWYGSLDETGRLLTSTDVSRNYRVMVLDTEGCLQRALELVRMVRRGGASGAVMLLGGHATPADRARGLDAGADDYVTKPFDVEELCARVRALARRPTGLASQPPPLRHGRLTLDLEHRQVVRCGRPVSLSRREYALLELLVTSCGCVVTRREIEDRLYSWSDDLGSNAVDVHVHHLRRKLGRGLITTVRGVGYLVEPVAAPAGGD